MNKKEILEIRKLLTKENTHIDKISCCYVDANKEKKACFTQSFYSVTDEIMFKYSDIFRKTLSGTVGKNLNTVEFSTEEEVNGEKYARLYKILQGGLDDAAANEEFFDLMIEKYSYAENYLIILAHGLYDIPTKTKDDIEVFDGSEYVYNFIICSVCPVKLSKPGLCYDSDSNSFIEHLRDWMVEMPNSGFLFPAFNDRNTDLHSILLYSKKADEQHTEFAQEIIGCEPPSGSKEQKLNFNSMVEEVLGDKCDFDRLKEIHENLNKIIEEKKDEPEPPALEKNDIKNLLSECGADEEKLALIDECFDTEAGKTERIMLSNVANTRKFEVSASDLKIQISADRTDMIDTMIIDGREYIVIPLSDEVEVNGLPVHRKNTKD